MIVALALLAAMPQTDPVDEPGPPQEGLLRSYENISSVLCLAPERDAILREVGHRYAKRMRAVRAAVAREFGSEAADRGYISIQSCRLYRWDVDLKRAADTAVDQFERELVGWEKRYNLRGRVKS